MRAFAAALPFFSFLPFAFRRRRGAAAFFFDLRRLPPDIERPPVNAR